MDLNPTNTFGKVEFEGREMYLIGRSEGERSYEENFMNTIRNTQTASFNIGEIAEIKKEKALNQIRRTNQAYQRTISLNYLGNYRMGREYIESVIEETPVPVGTSIEFGNFSFSFNDEEQTKNIWLIALLSILSVWMIVSALLEVGRDHCLLFLPPFVVLESCLEPCKRSSFRLGPLQEHYIGVVVNNAILLIHQTVRAQSGG